MSPNDIKRIVNCVVDYGWPWQFEGWDDPFALRERRKLIWITPQDQSLDTLLDLYLTSFDIEPGKFVRRNLRLDPNLEHDWAVETRHGMPCWAIEPGHNIALWFPAYVKEPYIVYPDGSTAWSAPGHHNDWHVGVLQCVAPHPLNPTMEPPKNWEPENKRILK